MSKVALFAPLPGGSSQPTRITPDLADVCIIDVVGETGKVPRLKVKSREASLAPLCNVFMRVPLEKIRPLWFEMVFDKKRPVVVEHFTPDMIEFAF